MRSLCISPGSGLSWLFSCTSRVIAAACMEFSFTTAIPNFHGSSAPVRSLYFATLCSWALTLPTTKPMRAGTSARQGAIIPGQQQGHHQCNLCLCKEAPRAPAAPNANWKHHLSAQECRIMAWKEVNSNNGVSQREMKSAASSDLLPLSVSLLLSPCHAIH
jgi:hypothetical protein